MFFFFLSFSLSLFLSFFLSPEFIVPMQEEDEETETVVAYVASLPLLAAGGVITNNKYNQGYKR